MRPIVIQTEYRGLSVCLSVTTIISAKTAEPTVIYRPGCWLDVDPI